MKVSLNRKKKVSLFWKLGEYPWAHVDFRKYVNKREISGVKCEKNQGDI